MVITDYPDDTIMKNLAANVERNKPHVNEKCTVHARGYEWGQDVTPLLSVPAFCPTLYAQTMTQRLFTSNIASEHTPNDRAPGFDVVILSDLLHFDRSHDVLLQSLLTLLRRAPAARAYVAAGTYTAPHICAHFVRAAAEAGIVLEEGEVEPVWRGALGVSGGGLDREQLGVRKGMSRWWVGRWAGI